MITRQYRTERPAIVVTPNGTMLQGFYTLANATAHAKAGRHRLVLLRNQGAWKVHAEYKRGKRVMPAATTK